MSLRTNLAVGGGVEGGDAVGGDLGSDVGLYG